MDAKYFREKAELCLRLADGLSVNNPGRFQLMDLADDFLEKAKELEANKVKEESIRHELLRLLRFAIFTAIRRALSSVSNLLRMVDAVGA